MNANKFIRVVDLNPYWTDPLFIQPKIFALNFLVEKVWDEIDLAGATPVGVRVVLDQELELLNISVLHL